MVITSSLCESVVNQISLYHLIGLNINDRAVIYIYIYIVIHWQICLILSELISVARHTSFLYLGSEPSWLKRQFKALPLNHEELVEVK